MFIIKMVSELANGLDLCRQKMALLVNSLNGYFRPLWPRFFEFLSPMIPTPVTTAPISASRRAGPGLLKRGGVGQVAVDQHNRQALDFVLGLDQNHLVGPIPTEIDATSRHG